MRDLRRPVFAARLVGVLCLSIPGFAACGGNSDDDHSDTAEPDTATVQTDADTAPPDTDDAPDTSEVPGEVTDPLPGPTLAFFTSPPTFVEVGHTYLYRPLLVTAEPQTFVLEDAPDGVTLVDDKLTWIPTEDDVGIHDIVLTGSAGGESTTQYMRVQVAKVTILAQAQIGAAGGVVGVTGTGPGAGATISIPAGALDADRIITIGVTDTPVLPAAIKEAAAPTFVFGPSGTVFTSPVTVTLPVLPTVPADDLHELATYLQNTATGAWDALSTRADKKNRLLVANVSHFSLVTVGSEAAKAKFTLYKISEDILCHGQESPGIFLQSELEPSLAVLPSTLVQGLPNASATTSVKEAFLGRGQPGTLVVAHKLESPALVELRAELYVDGQGGGRLRLSIGGAGASEYNGHPRELYSKDLPDVRLAWDSDVEPMLRQMLAAVLRIDSSWSMIDARIAMGFCAASSCEVAGSVVAKAYFSHLDWAWDPPRPRPPEVLDPPFTDDNCSHIIDSHDTFLTSRLPKLSTGELTQTVKTDTALVLKCLALTPTGDLVRVEWQAPYRDGTVRLTSGPGPGEVTFTARVAGVYKVTCEEPNLGELRATYQIVVKAPDPENRPPTCNVSGESGPFTASTAVGLTAVAADPDGTTPLMITWGVIADGAFQESAAFSTPTGDRTAFTPAASGTFTVACRASDGLLTSEPGKKTIEVVAPAVNLPPKDLLVSPSSITIAPEEPLTFRVGATDPEAAALRFEIEGVGSTTDNPGEISLAADNPLRRREGTHVTTLEVSDGESSIAVPVELTVLAPAAIDNDQDGSAANGEVPDCDDTNRLVNPNATEICGNQIDEDCKGGLDNGFTLPCPALAGDSDSDLVADATDNCRTVSNPDQKDTNGNGIGDVCDCATSCDDQSRCTVDACDTVARKCTNTKKCSDENLCTTDRCDGTTGACSFPSNVTRCNDENECTNDSCDPQLGCVNDSASADTACATDNNPCTDDKCDGDGACAHTNNTATCDDGKTCTAGDKCVGGVCAGTESCDDDDPCTDDMCDGSGACVHTNNTATCDDGKTCTTGDVCAGGMCVGTESCNDNNPCTDDGGCKADGTCARTNNTASCNDGKACTTDVCNAGECVGTVSCNDNNPCTDDGCNGAGACVNTDNTAPCDDGDACTNEACSNGKCTASPKCDDNDLCTTDVCTDGTCSTEPIVGCCTGACNDGNDCTTAEQCVDNDCKSIPSGAPGCGTAGTCGAAHACMSACIDAGGALGGTCVVQCGNALSPSELDKYQSLQVCVAIGGNCGASPTPACLAAAVAGPCATRAAACPKPPPVCVPADCNDNDPCTTDACNGGTCSNIPIPGCGAPSPCGDAIDCIGACVDGGTPLSNCSTPCAGGLTPPESQALFQLNLCIESTCSPVPSAACYAAAVASGGACFAQADICRNPECTLATQDTDCAETPPDPCTEDICEFNRCEHYPVATPECQGVGECSVALACTANCIDGVTPAVACGTLCGGVITLPQASLNYVGFMACLETFCSGTPTPQCYSQALDQDCAIEASVCESGP